MWLKDFLPLKIPGARVLLYGYNSNVAIDTTLASVSEHADNLLDRLGRMRAEENNVFSSGHRMKWFLKNDG